MILGNLPEDNVTFFLSQLYPHVVLVQPRVFDGKTEAREEDEEALSCVSTLGAGRSRAAFLSFRTMSFVDPFLSVANWCTFEYRL